MTKKSKELSWPETAYSTTIPVSPATDRQVGGNWYAKMKIQPAEFIYANDIPFIEGSVIQYVCRWKEKGGVVDLEKAKHLIDLLIEFSEKYENK